MAWGLAIEFPFWLVHNTPKDIGWPNFISYIPNKILINTALANSRIDKSVSQQLN